LRVLELDNPYFGYVEEEFADRLLSRIEHGNWWVSVAGGATLWLQGKEALLAMNIDRNYDQDRQIDGLVDEMEGLMTLYEP
jgi:hypothetical protein